MNGLIEQFTRNLHITYISIFEIYYYFLCTQSFESISIPSNVTELKKNKRVETLMNWERVSNHL